MIYEQPLILDLFMNVILEVEKPFLLYWPNEETKCMFDLITLKYDLIRKNFPIGNVSNFKVGTKQTPARDWKVSHSKVGTKLTPARDWKCFSF